MRASGPSHWLIRNAGIGMVGRTLIRLRGDAVEQFAEQRPLAVGQPCHAIQRGAQFGRCRLRTTLAGGRAFIGGSGDRTDHRVAREGGHARIALRLRLLKQGEHDTRRG